jgi:hypothetical protein
MTQPNPTSKLCLQCLGTGSKLRLNWAYTLG